MGMVDYVKGIGGRIWDAISGAFGKVVITSKTYLKVCTMRLQIVR